MGVEDEEQDYGIEAVTYRVTTYYKRRPGSPGLTNLSSRRLVAAEALSWILADLPDEAWTVSTVEGEKDTIVTLVIDWGKAPASVANPKIPTRNGRRL